MEKKKQEKVERRIKWNIVSEIKNGEFSETVKYEIYCPEENKNVADVEIDFRNKPFPHVYVKNIQVYRDEKEGYDLRGKSNSSATGYGGTIIRQINKMLDESGLLGVLKNETQVQNSQVPQVVDFYLEHKWNYLHPEENESNKYMYYVGNDPKLTKSQMERIKTIYTLWG